MTDATGTRAAWEYVVLVDDIVTVKTWDLKEYGEFGWELVSVIQKKDGKREFFFKREKAE